MQLPNERFLANAPFGCLFDWQCDMLKSFDEGMWRQGWFEIHRRGRKTSTAINLQFRECAKHAKTRHIYIGPTFAEGRRIVWDDPHMIADALPDPKQYPWKRNQQNFTISFPNGSMWQILGGDDPNSLRGIDAESFVFDEWAQQDPKCLQVIQPILQQSPERWAAFLYTPCGNNHATQGFDDAACISDGYALPTNGRAAKCKPGTIAIRVCADKSGVFTPAALDEARHDRMMTTQMFEQEYLCARVADEDMVLITSAMLEALARDITPPRVAASIIACDPSQGGDACVIDVQRGPKTIEHKSLRTRDTMRIVGELRMISDRTGILDFGIDSIGIGAGICDRLAEDARYNVIRVNSGEAASNADRFANRRAEMWWTAREDVDGFSCEYPHDDETRRQIPVASRYKVGSNGKIHILGKADIRKLLGRSPDDADAWAIGRYAIRQARPCAGRLMDFVVQVPSEGDDQPAHSDPFALLERGY